ncbi:hypothetical protein UlMin_043838 [Ulmus minor]
MALPGISKTHQKLCKLRNLINPNALLSLIFTRSLIPTSQPHRPFSTNPHNEYSLTSEHTDVANGLISIFTKQPFSPENPELKHFAPLLTTKLVETVLNGFNSWKLAHLFFTWASKQYGYKHNCYTYNTMASILSRVKQNAPLGALALDIINSECLMTPGALGFFIRCLGSVGLVEEANFLFDQVKAKGLCVPNSYSYACLLEAITKSNSMDLLEMRLKEMQDSGLAFDKHTLTPLLGAYCNVGNLEKAMKVLGKMSERGWVDAHVLSIIVVSFAKKGKVDKAYELIERMEDHNFGLNEKTFYVLIHGFVRESRIDRALQLFSKRRKWGFNVDMSLYDVLIGGLCKNKKFEEAWCLYAEMKELGICPDVGILTKLISCCSDEQEMIRLLEETHEDMDKKSIIWLYNSVLKGLINMGSADEAYYLLQTIMGKKSNSTFEVDKLLMIKVLPDTSSFQIVICDLLKTSKLDLALSLFNDMIQIGCKPDVLICNNLIDGLCNSNRLEEGYEILREMEASGLELTHFTHNSLYGCLCRRDDVVGALDLIKRMRLHGHEPWMKHSNLLVKRLCKHGKVVEACKFLHDMLQEGFLPHIVAYSPALDGLMKTHEVERALLLFEEICVRGCCPDVVAYNIVINGLCKAKRVSEAQSLVNEMMMKGLVPSVVTYNLLIDGWCKIGDIDQALLCLSRMFSEDDEREPSVVTYSTLIDGLCTAGRSDDALSLYNEMGSKGCAPNRITFMALISGLCKCSRPSTALVYLRKMEEMEMEPESFVYVALLTAFLSESNLPMAFEILKEMVEKGSIPDPRDKNHSVVRDAIFRLLADDRSFSSVKALIANGSFPTINFSEFGIESLQPTNLPLIGNSKSRNSNP